MDLEQALKEIERLKGELSGVSDNQATAVKEATDKLNEEHKKALQISYNKGFDKSKNTSDEEKKGYLSKEDVDKLIGDNNTSHERIATLKAMGIKNPKRALRLIDDEDLSSFGSEDFNKDEFIEKYQEDIVFSNDKPNDFSKNITKNNQQQKKELTAETYAGMSTADRMKVSKEDRANLV